VHRERVTYSGDLYRIPSRHRCRIDKCSIIHLTFHGQLVGQPPEDEPFTAATVFDAPHQVSGNLSWREVRRWSQQALQEGVLRVQRAILGLFDFVARSCRGR
jgi:hypothetical protein